ncbi:protein phosphatase 1 regulatory subunit 14C isoform X2 [Rhodnius prolixus]
MEVGVASSYNSVMRSGAARGDVASTERSPGKGLHVNFSEKGEVKERREKFLTAKYGSHQMSLIRKRLAVEMWLYDELQKLYESADKTTPEVEVDIDELLDMDDDAQRRNHLQGVLCDAKKSPHDVKKFVDDLLERTKTL